jgi:hypothetical protein
MDQIGEERKEQEADSADNQEATEDPNASSKANIYFFAAICIIILLFAAIFAVRIFIKQEDNTVDGMIAKTLRGEENPETNYKYNGFVFVKVGPLWYTKWQYKEYQLNIPLHYGPLELEDVKAEGKLDERFNTGQYYITFDPNGTDFAYVAVAAGEVGRNLVEGLGAKISSACLTNHTVCEGKPIITCENTNSSVIYIKESEDPKLVMKGNCLIIQGKGGELVKVADRVILQIYGVMK